MADNQAGSVYVGVIAETGRYQTEIGKAEAAHKRFMDSVERGSTRGSQAYTRAQQEMEKASSKAASAFVNVGQQVQDAAIQWQSGTNVVTILAQQLPQAVSALNMFGGSWAAAATFGASFVAIGAVAVQTIMNMNKFTKEAPENFYDLGNSMEDAAGKAEKLIKSLEGATLAELQNARTKAKIRIDAANAAAEENQKALTEGIRADTEVRARLASDAARVRGEIPTAMGSPLLAERRRQEIEAPIRAQGEQQSKNVTEEIKAAVRRGDPDAVESIIARNNLLRGGNEQVIDLYRKAAVDTKLFRGYDELAQELAAQGKARPPQEQRTGLPETAGAGGRGEKATKQETAIERIYAEEEATKRLVAAYSTSIAEGKRVEAQIAAEQELRRAGITIKDKEYNQLLEIVTLNKQRENEAMQSQTLQRLKMESAGYEELLKRVKEGKQLSQEEEAAIRARNAAIAAGADESTELGKQIINQAMASARLNVQLQEEQRLQGRRETGDADDRNRRSKAIDSEREAIERMLGSARQELNDRQRLAAAAAMGAEMHRMVADALDVEAAGRRLGAEATSAQRAEIERLTKATMEQIALEKQAIALRDVPQQRARLIAEGKMTPASEKDIGKPAKPPVVKQQTFEEIEKALNIPQIGQTGAEQAGAYTDAWKNAIEDLQGFVTDAFQQLFEGQLDSADAFAKSLRSIIARGAANMLSGVIFGGAGGGLLGGAGGQRPAANNNFAAPFSLSSLMGGAAPVGNYSQMSLEEARMRMMHPTVQAQQAPSLTGWWQGMTPAQQQRMIGLGGMGLATVGGMMGGQVGQFNPQGLMSTVGTGMLMGQGMGVGALGGAGAMLWGSLTGRAAGGGMLGGGLGALGGAGIGFATGGPLGALAGGLLGGLGGFMGGGDREPRNNAAFSFDLGTGRGRQDNSPGPGDPNRQAAVQLVKQLGEAVTAIRRLGFGIGGGTISSSVSRTRTAAEAEAELVDQLRRRVGASDRGFAGHTARVSQATDLQGLLEDINFGREMSDLIQGTNDFQKAMRDLNATLQGNVDRARAMNASERDLAAIRKAGQDQVRDYIRSQMYDFMATVGEGSDLAPEIRQLSEAFKVAAQQAKTFGFSETELANARTEAMRKFTSQAEEQMRAANDNLRGFIDNLTEPLRAALGPQGIGRGVFSPQAQANQALEQFRETMDAARRDDVEAIQNLPQMAQNAVEAARQFGASGPEFQRIFQEVQRGLSEVLSAQEDRRAQVFADLPEIMARTAGEQIETLRDEFARTREELEMVRREIRLLAA